MSDHTITDTVVAADIVNAFADVETTEAYGYTFFFYRDDRMRPFATLAHQGNDHERVSNLDRPGVFRLNIGVSGATFQDLFGTAKVDVSAYDFTTLDTLMPHPEYAAQHFVCVLNPGPETYARVKALLAEAYDLAVQRHRRQRPKTG